MGDGWTGIDISAVAGQLRTLDEAFMSLMNVFGDALHVFSESLQRSWASEKAVEFNSKLEAIGEAYVYIQDVADEIIPSASRAAEFMARYNGAEFSFDYVRWNQGRADICMLAEEKDGVKGMNITLAKFALDAFKQSMANVIARVEELPIDLSLLDPASELQNEYKALVNKAKTNIEISVGDAVTALEEAFTTEEMNIRLGKTQAESQLAA